MISRFLHIYSKNSILFKSSMFLSLLTSIERRFLNKLRDLYTAACLNLRSQTCAVHELLCCFSVHFCVGMSKTFSEPFFSVKLEI